MKCYIYLERKVLLIYESIYTLVNRKEKKMKKWIALMSLTAALALGVFGGKKIEVHAAEVKKAETVDVAAARKAEIKMLKSYKKDVKIEDYSAIFDADFYYNMYPDLQAALKKDPEVLFQHFVEFGMKEGRVGCPNFDVKAYMKNNPDLVGLFKADDLREYYAHYVKYGIKENRVSLYQEGQAPAEGVLATHTTYYDPSEARATNVELAASRMNGMVIKPGNTFSYSDSVGPRTKANGYVNGPSFANGIEVSSIGGGICQVSSTLYVSLLLAGIEPIEHHYHSLPVDYVPLGLDAAISQGVQDLRFKNTADYNIVIEAIAENGVLTVSLLRE